MIGSGHTFRTPATIRRVTSGSVAKSVPPETFGHDRFNSSPASPSVLPICSAIVRKLVLGLAGDVADQPRSAAS